jgi:hypothetical protein
MSPKSYTEYSSLLKVALATFVGAIFGALSMSTIPTTIDGWKQVLAPALGAGIAAEIVFLRTQLSKFLSSMGATDTTLTGSASAPSSTTATTTAEVTKSVTKIGGVLAFLVGIVCGFTTNTGCKGSVTPNEVVQDITPAGACIAQQLLVGGATDPLQIIAACAGTAIEDVIQVVEQLNAQQNGGPPSALKMRLAAVHTRALGLKAVPR